MGAHRRHKKSRKELIWRMKLYTALVILIIELIRLLRDLLK